MAYLNCPNCRMSLYSGAAHSIMEECPRCLGTLERRIPMFSTERRFEAPFGFRETVASSDIAEEHVSR